MTFVGIDNGVTGTIAILDGDKSIFMETPVFETLGYQKSKVRHINRIDTVAFQASISAARAIEATLIVLEELGLGYEYLDSGAWQKALLPAGIKGAVNLKKASKDVGLRMFPMHADTIKKHGDADAILIAEWARRRGG